MIGNPVVVVDGQVRTFRALSVREVVTVQNALAARMAADAVTDARAAGMTPADAVQRAAAAREEARLSSSLIRSCFTLEGATRIVEQSTGREDFAAATDGMSPDTFTELALMLVGYEWDQSASKWRRRSALPDGAKLPGNG